jgi:hypothetical protein
MIDGWVSNPQNRAPSQMLGILASLAKCRAANFVALVYLASVMMPSVTVAFADGAGTAYCLEEITAQVAPAAVHVHVHGDGTVHHHADKTPATAIHDESGKRHPGTQAPIHSHDVNCCGLFGFTAVLPELGGAITRSAAGYVQPPMLADHLAGRGPDRINRPPIVLLPM